MALIKLVNVKKSYGNFKLEVSIEIDKGITTILGNSGAGKTTLLRIIALLEKFDGDYYFNGEKVNDGHRRYITMVFQHPVVFRGTAIDNVMYALSLEGKADKNKALELLEMVNLSNVAYKKAKLLSGGEKQRLAIARALALDREVYLFDEPTSNLDTENVKIIEKRIKDLSKNGRTVIVATHNLLQARRISDKVVFLDDGKVIEVSDAEEIFKKVKIDY